MQEPRLVVDPPKVGSYATEAAGFAGAYGLTPDPWQFLVLEAWLGYRSDGKWSSSRCGLSVPRQNGKNGLLEIRELFGMVGLGEKILHTAHEVKTARKAFLRIASFFENERKYPELAGLVAPGGIRKTNGQEAIVLTNGGSVEFVARSKGSARGFTVDVVVMDEAQDLSDEQLESLLPTTSAAPLRNRQLIWTGTPPIPGADGSVFTRIRHASLTDGVDRQCWHEWSFPDDADLDDVETWLIGNPAAGIRLGLEEIAEDRASLSDDGFGRERGGMWVSAASQRVISEEMWSALKIPPPQGDLGGEMSIAIDVSPDRNMTTMCSVLPLPGGVPYLSVQDTLEGPPEWVVPRIVDACRKYRVRAVVVDGAGPAGSLIEGLRNSGIEPTVTGVAQMKRACGAFYDAVGMKSFRHKNQPILNRAVSAVRKRKLEDAFAWQRKDAEADITPVVAATLALWGFTATDVKRPRKRSGGATFV